MDQTDRASRFRIVDILLFLAGILVFAGFIGEPGMLILIGVAGIVLSAIIISLRIRSLKDFILIFGFGRLSLTGIYFLLISILGGMLFGMIYRNSLSIGVFPSRITHFAILASLVGASEELLFRGYLQTQTRRFGAMISILAGTSGHTLYKFCFFLSMQAGMEISLSGLVIWTLAGGIIFGTIKELSKSTWFPIICHVIFDIIVYGDRTIAPWWIW